MVFFDYEADNLFPQGQATLEQLVNSGRDLKQVWSTQCYGVTVIPHIDTAEAETRGDSLPLDRGNAVRDRLIAMGIPRDLVRVDISRARQLLVPTEANVREPQNRRAELVITLAEGTTVEDLQMPDGAPVPSMCGPGYYRIKARDGSPCLDTSEYWSKRGWHPK
jgi:hypothetical protein